MKGQMLVVLSLMAILFIVTGNMFSAVIAQNEITKSVSYSSNDANELLRAEIKADVYAKNIEKELNYSLNNIAYLLGSNSGPNWEELNWEDNIPDQDRIKSVFKQKMISGEYGIANQNRLWGCDTPQLAEEPLEKVGSDPVEIELTLSKAQVECSSGRTTAIASIPEQYTIENDNNNLFELTDYARTLAQKVKEISPDRLEESGSASTNSCRSPDQSDAQTQARANARDNTVQGEENIAEEAYQETEDSRESFITGEHDTIILGDFSQVDSDETPCFYDCDCPEGPEDRDGSCRCEGTKYSYTYNYTVDEINTDFDLVDSNNEVLTYDGQKSLDFDFRYSQTLR
jgi:hypothetical protein